MNTNLASQIQRAFALLAQAAAQPSEPRKTLLQCWQEVAGTNTGIGRANFFEVLGILSSSLDRLSVQIRASSILDETGKSEAQRVVAGLHECLSPDRFHTQVVNLKDRIAGDRLGLLNILGPTLQQQFDEAKIETAEKGKIEADVRALIESVRSALLEENLRALLLRHLSFLLYAVQQMEIVGAEGVYEAIGRALVTVQRLPEDVPESAPHSESLKARIKAACGRVLVALRVAKDIDEGVAALEDFADAGLQILDDLTGA